MPGPIPLTKGQSLREEISSFNDGLHEIGEYDHAEFKRIEAACKQLQGRNVIEASLCLALLNSAIYDDAETERWLKNAELNGAVAHARFERFAHCVNHGEATKAQALAGKVFEAPVDQTLMHIALGLGCVGGFQMIVDAIDRATKKGMVLKMTPILDISRRSAAVMKQMNLKDSQVALVIDEAAALMRERGLCWHAAPIDIAGHDETRGGPAMAINYRISQTPEFAAQLSGELIDRLIEKDMDIPGLSVGYFGQHIEEFAL